MTARPWWLLVTPVLPKTCPVCGLKDPGAQITATPRPGGSVPVVLVTEVRYTPCGCIDGRAA